MLSETDLTLIKIMVLKGMDNHEIMSAISTLKTEKLEEKMLELLRKRDDIDHNDIMMLTSGQMKMKDGTSL